MLDCYHVFEIKIFNLFNDKLNKANIKISQKVIEVNKAEYKNSATDNTFTKLHIT